MTLHIRNTLTGKKELFTPLVNQQVGMYACGVTVYDDCHIGHAMQAIFFDVIRNFLNSQGFKVTYVRNFTDVDDKIIARAKNLSISPKTLAENMIASSLADMQALRIKPADFEPKVSETIPEIIAMISELVDKRIAYATPTGDVYYRVKEKKDYGKLSHRKVEELLNQTREELVGTENKEDNLDFALWKKDTTVDASWDSPWGRGRPGWHIECSAMAKKHLGVSFDIHGGGRDLVFPHHENEIAQSESANGAAYASLWLHTGLLTVDKQKMSKSLGNFITIKDFLKEWHPEILRLCYLQNHYASNIDFSLDFFKLCRRRLIYYYETLLLVSEIANHTAQLTEATADETKSIDDFVQSFNSAMCDDFNTPQAFGELNKFFKWLNKKLAERQSLSKTAAHRALEVLNTVASIFGVFSEDPRFFLQAQKSKILADVGLSEGELQTLIHSRAKAREDKDWAKSDAVRNELLAKGILLKDNQESTTWTVAY
jgi:cysteinyl-tRNA synthetase